MIATRMGAKPPTITEMLQKLDSEGLIHYDLYNGAILTDSGKKWLENGFRNTVLS